MPEPDARQPPDELTDDMTRADLVEVLEHLPWRRDNLCSIRLDRDVRVICYGC
jgi:hypothetical protein